MFHYNFPKFLDKILLAFSNDYNISKSLDELTQIVFKNQITKGYDLNKPNKNLKTITDELFNYPKYLEYALNFLDQEGLIKYDKSAGRNEKSISITSKGFLKIKTEGFSAKIKNDKFNICLQRAVWISALITLGITIYIQLIKTNTSCNCTCKTYKNSIHNAQSYPISIKSQK